MTNRKQNNPEVTRDRWDIYRFARWFVNDCNKKLLSSTSKRCIAGVKLHYKWCMVMRQTSTSLEGNSFTEKGCVWIKREFLRRSNGSPDYRDKEFFEQGQRTLEGYSFDLRNKILCQGRDTERMRCRWPKS